MQELNKVTLIDVLPQRKADVGANPLTDMQIRRAFRDGGSIQVNQR